MHGEFPKAAYRSLKKDAAYNALKTLKRNMAKIEEFLNSAKGVSIGSIELNISSPSQLDQHQQRYSKDRGGKSLAK